MTPNPTHDLNNMLTPSIETELTFIPGRLFKIRKADLMFDAWCAENYGSLHNYLTILTSKDGSKAKEISYAVVRGFYHLISPSDQAFLRDKVVVENPLDESGVEIKYSMVDKLMHASDIADVAEMVKCILIAKGYSSPNALTEEEKKKKSKRKTVK